MARRSILAGLLAFMVLATTGAAAQSPLASLVTPEEVPLLPRFAQAVTAPPAERQTGLDALLSELPRPTPLRGMVQMARAALLAERDFRGNTAMMTPAIEGAIRLLPDRPEPKLLAARIFIFSGQPQRAADLWLTASRENPQAAVALDNYFLMAMIGRLTEIGETHRADVLRDRLVETGYAGGTAAERSDRALAVIRARMRAGRVADARALVPQLVSVPDFAALATDRRQEPLWQAVDDWAGADFAKEHLIELEALRREWNGSHALPQAAAYGRALNDAGASAAVLTLFRPTVAEATGAETGAEFLAVVVAAALIHQGRTADAVTLLADAERRMAALSPSQRLNLSANRAINQLRADQPDAALATFEQVTAMVRARGPEVNRAAALAIESGRLCTLHALGRGVETASGRAMLLFAAQQLPGPAATLHVCTEDANAYRALILDRLADEDGRAWALAKMQPQGLPTGSAYDRRQHAFVARMQADPILRRAAEKVGRILPAAPGAALPPGFNPLAQ